MNSRQSGRSDREQPKYDEAAAADAPGDRGELEDRPEPEDRLEPEDLLEQVVAETSRGGKAFYPIVVRFANSHRDGDITRPELAADLIHQILDYRFDGKALPVNCHHWVASQLLQDDLARERLVALWQQALTEGE